MQRGLGAAYPRRWPYYSAELRLGFVIVEETPAARHVRTDDGVVYRPAECELLTRERTTVSRAVHIIKKAFNGTITGVLTHRREAEWYSRKSN